MDERKSAESDGLREMTSRLQDAEARLSALIHQNVSLADERDSLRSKLQVCVCVYICIHANKKDLRRRDGRVCVCVCVCVCVNHERGHIYRRICEKLLTNTSKSMYQ